MSDYRTDFRAGQREFYWTLPRLMAGTAVIMILFGAMFWVFGILGQGGRIMSKTLDANNVINTYEWYRDAWGNEKAKKSQVGQFKGLLAKETDPAEQRRLRIELAAIQQSCRELIQRYNANANKINKRIFMGTSVPESIDTGDCD